MSELTLDNLVKIYPFTDTRRLFGRKQARDMLARERAMPYTTNEGVIAVQQFSLEIRQGEFVVLLGPSGSGKTSVLRMIAGLESVSDGTITMDGKVINDVPPAERNMAMIFQNYSLYPGFTVYDNLAYPLRNLHMPRAQVDAKVRAAAELLELTPLLDRRPSELSGGQQQRTAVGRALVRDPGIFLMDEPMSNQDPALKARLREELKRIHRKLGATVLYVTHDQTDALSLGDRIVLMKDGMAVQTGTPGELYRTPRNLYCATFLGAPEMNVFRHVPVRNGALCLLGREIRLPEAKAAVTAGLETVTAGIRPVHFSLDPEGVGAAVDYTETVESECHLHLKLGEEAFTAVVPKPPDRPFAHGETVRVSPDPERIHLFHPQTEIRLG